MPRLPAPPAAPLVLGLRVRVKPDSEEPPDGPGKEVRGFRPSRLMA
jgi:hypothetical protein